MERSHFGYLNRFQTKKTWFPKTTVTILPPVKLPVDQTLRGKTRRQAAGAALQDIMVNTAVLTANLDQTLFSALVEAKATRDTGKPAIEDPLGTKLSYKKLILGAQVLGRKIAPLAPEGAAVGVLLPNAAGVAVTFFALQSIGRVAGDAQLLGRRAEHDLRVPGGEGGRGADLARLRREGEARRRGGEARRPSCRSSTWKTSRRRSARRTSSRVCGRAPRRSRSASPTIRRRSCSRRVRRGRQKASSCRTETCSRTRSSVCIALR